MRILSAARRYPVSIARYMENALRREGHEVLTVGPYSGDAGEQPWKGGKFSYPEYLDRPSIILPYNLLKYPVTHLAGLPPRLDAVISWGAGFRLTGRLQCVPTVLYGTDPHALDYRPFHKDYDLFCCAQQEPLIGGQLEGVWVPLAHDPEVHYRTQPPIPDRRPVDVAFVGVMGEGNGPDNPYALRWETIRRLKEQTCMEVVACTGVVYDACREVYNLAKCAISVSSSWDVPMRNWEGMAYGCCLVAQRLPGWNALGFVDGQDYLGFSSVDEAVQVTIQAVKSGRWAEIAENGWRKVTDGQRHTYAERVRRIIEHLRMA